MRDPRPSRQFFKREQKRNDSGYRINREINAAEVRLIDEQGRMLGLYTSRQAQQIAEDRGLDLIEIGPNANPPTCKIMDYGKWKYELKKKDKASKKKQTVITVKELQIRPRTDEHDLQTKLRHARRFLLEGDKVKFNLRFQGREMVHQEVGVKVLQRVVKELLELAVVETPPKHEGRQMFTLLAPDPVKVKDYEKKHPQKVSTREEADKDAEKGAAEDAAESVANDTSEKSRE